MVALLVCAYCLGVRTSRQIERAWQVDLAFGVVAANQTPDHTTEDKAAAKEKKVNTTDPESKVMSSSKGSHQGYNARAVANEDQVVVAAEVTDEQKDPAQPHPMIKANLAALEARTPTSTSRRAK